MCRGRSDESAWKCCSLHGQSHANCMKSPCQLNIRAFRMTYYCSVSWSLVHHYRVHRLGRPHAMFRGKYLAQLRVLLPVKTITPTAGGPSGTVCPPVASTTSRTDGLGATPRPPRRRRRQQKQIRDTPYQITPRLTEQDPLMAAGAVVFDCRPALLPVSVDVSGH